MRARDFQFGVSHLLIASALVAAIVSAVAAYGTVYEVYGWLAEAFYPWALGIFLFTGFCCLAFRKLRKSVVVLMIVVCVGFSYRQTMLVNRLQNLKEEVKHIVEYVEKENRDKGAYPDDLSGYSFQRPGLQRYVDYYTTSVYGPYVILFHPVEDPWMFPFQGLGIYHGYSPGADFFFEDD